MSAGEKLGDVAIRPTNAGNSGDLDVGARAGEKLGDMAMGVIFGDCGIDDATWDNTGVEGTKFGDAGGISGDTDFCGMLGRKFGDVANESVRLDVEWDAPSVLDHNVVASWLTELQSSMLQSRYMLLGCAVPIYPAAEAVVTADGEKGTASSSSSSPNGLGNSSSSSSR